MGLDDFAKSKLRLRSIINLDKIKARDPCATQASKFRFFENLSLVKNFSERCRIKLGNAQTHGKTFGANQL